MKHDPGSIFCQIKYEKFTDGKMTKTVEVDSTALCYLEQLAMVEGVVMAMLFSDLLDGIIAIASRHCAALPMGMDLLEIGIDTHRISACTLRYQDSLLLQFPKVGADNYFYMHIEGRFGFQKLCPGH